MLYHADVGHKQYACKTQVQPSAAEHGYLVKYPTLSDVASHRMVASLG